MSGQMIGHIIEAVVCASPFVGIPLLVFRDPADKIGQACKERGLEVLDVWPDGVGKHRRPSERSHP